MAGELPRVGIGSRLSFTPPGEANRVEEPGAQPVETTRVVFAVDALWVVGEVYCSLPASSSGELLGAVIDSYERAGACDVRSDFRYRLPGGASVHGCVLDVVREHGDATSVAVVATVPSPANGTSGLGEGVILSATWPAGQDGCYLELAAEALASLDVADQ